MSIENNSRDRQQTSHHALPAWYDDTVNMRDIYNCKILIVEDDLTQRMILRQILETHGFCHIMEVENGQEGIDKVRASIPDLVLVDINMPVMNGIEFCHFIRSEMHLHDLPLIVQSGISTPKQKAEVFAIGASDFLEKPLQQEEVIARVHFHLRHNVITRQLKAFQSRIEKELQTAARMHEGLIPKDEELTRLSKQHGATIKHYEKSSTELGGDFWGIHALSHAQLLIYTVDFSGHGVIAALNTFRLHTIMQNHLWDIEDPGQFLNKMNKKLHAILLPEQFATMFVGIVDTEAEKLHFATAASPAPLVFSPSGKAHMLDSRGFLLGTEYDAVYETKTLDFQPGSSLFLYSDALIESPNHKGKMLDEYNLISTLQDTPEKAFDTLLARLHQDYPKQWPDDLTMVLVKTST